MVAPTAARGGWRSPDGTEPVAGQAKGRRRRPWATPPALHSGPSVRAGRAHRRTYFTVTVLTADVLAVPEYVTRTRILYLPLVAGARHLSE